MKKVKKLIIAVLTATILLFTVNVKAQTVPAHGVRMGIGLDAGEPTGNLTIGSTFVLGGTISLQYGITDRFAVALTSGADHFFSKYKPGTHVRYDSFGIIPIKAGFKAFYTPNLYVDAEAGVGIEETDSGTGLKKFLFSPALGWANSHWDVSFRYDTYYTPGDNYGFVAVRIAYGFAL
jgi:hypothetical protein